MNSLRLAVSRPSRKNGRYPPSRFSSAGVGSGYANASRKATHSARGTRAEWKQGSWTEMYTNMAGSEVDDLASLEATTVNEGAVVELIRRRYSQNKIYVSKVLAARACFTTAVRCFPLCFLAPRIMQDAMPFC